MSALDPASPTSKTATAIEGSSARTDGQDNAVVPTPGKVRVEVLDRKASEKARVDGPLVRVDPGRRAVRR